MAKLQDLNRITPENRAAKRLYNLNEASVYLGRSVGALRELIWKGEIPCVKVGRRIHLDLVDINAFIERNKIQYLI